MRALFATHRTPVYRWLLRFMSDEIFAEDLLSEVFLDVWRRADRFEGRSSVSTRLMSIARYKGPLAGALQAGRAGSTAGPFHFAEVLMAHSWLYAPFIAAT
jgi:hypothetical protein